jgi:hypothetical protein
MRSYGIYVFRLQQGNAVLPYNSATKDNSQYLKPPSKYLKNLSTAISTCAQGSTKEPSATDLMIWGKRGDVDDQVEIQNDKEVESLRELKLL